MKPETAAKIKFLGWGIVVGIIVCAIFGFAVLGWDTSGTVKKRIAKAELPLAAEICAQKFRDDPKFAEHLAALKAKDDWQRDSYIREKGKWAVMAGDKTPDYEVAEECVKNLSDLLE